MMTRLLLFLILAASTSGDQSALNSSDEQELMRLEQAYNDAQVKRDRATLEQLWADDYLYTHSNGAVMTKAQDVAVVTGRLVMEGRAVRYASGPRRFTDLFVRRNGRWQLVGGQTTIVGEK